MFSRLTRLFIISQKREITLVSIHLAAIARLDKFQDPAARAAFLSLAYSRNCESYRCSEEPARMATGGSHATRYYLANISVATSYTVRESVYVDENPIVICQFQLIKNKNIKPHWS